MSEIMLTYTLPGLLYNWVLQYGLHYILGDMVEGEEVVEAGEKEAMEGAEEGKWRTAIKGRGDSGRREIVGGGRRWEEGEIVCRRETVGGGGDSVEEGEKGNEKKWGI